MYNAEQLNFIPPLKRQPVKQDPYNRVTDLLANCGANIVHDQKERAFYNPANDEIHLPNPDSYKDINKYCQDDLNAYFHATGHPSRNDRQTFASPKKYQQNTEELICAIATTMMCAELGIPNDATKNLDLALKWAESLDHYPIQFGQAMQQVDRAVFQTLRLEQSINKQLNLQNEQGWRTVAEASPEIAVKTFLTQKEVLNHAENEPDKLNTFQHDDKEVYTIPGTGRIVGEKEVELDSPNMGTGFEITVLTDGYDHDGNTYDVTLKATVKVNESGLAQTIKQPEAIDIKLSTKEMSLLLDWTGEIAVSLMHEDEQGNMLHGRSDVFPEFYGAFARGQDADILLTTFNRENQATYYASLVEKQFQYQQNRLEENTQDRPPQQSIQTTQTGIEQGEQQPDQLQNREELLENAKKIVAKRLKEETQDADKAAERCKTMIAKTCSVPKEPTPYMKTKGVNLIPGTFQNKSTTCFPLYNVDGDLRSIAYVDKDGKKRYAKGSQRLGCAFFDKKAVVKSSVVGFSVGAATAATVSQNLNSVPVVATMDAANLPVVAPHSRKSIRTSNKLFSQASIALLRRKMDKKKAITMPNKLRN